MPRKNVLKPFHCFVNASMTGTSTVTSSVTNIQFLDNVSIQLQWTGTPNGTFSVQGSLDYAVNEVTGVVQNAGTWIEVTLPTTPIAAGVAGEILIDTAMLSFPWIRIQYTNTSSTGTLNGYISGKEV